MPDHTSDEELKALAFAAFTTERDFYRGEATEAEMLAADEALAVAKAHRLNEQDWRMSVHDVDRLS